MSAYDEPIARQPNSAGGVKKGDCAIMKGRPCKILEKTTCKTGKHGSTRCSITGTDILNNNKIIESLPSSAAMWSFQPRKVGYDFADYDEKNDQIKMIDENAAEVVYQVKENSDPNGCLPKIKEGAASGALMTIFLLCAPVEDGSHDDGVRMETIIDEIKVASE